MPVELLKDSVIPVIHQGVIKDFLFHGTFLSVGFLPLSIPIVDIVGCHGSARHSVA